MAAQASRPSALPPTLRLWIALAAVGAAALGLAGLRTTAQHLAAARTEAFNVFPQPDKLIGAALQSGVYRDPALLPVYGSSELTQPQANRADEFFRGHPSGFGAFLIGNPGEQCLPIATKLAAAGPGAARKKAVVFLSPGWFIVPELDRRGFGVNFSPLHAGIFAFESPLSAPLKQALARRLLEYPEMIGQSPLLDRALRDLAADTGAARIRQGSLAPLGWLYDAAWRESDDGKLALWWKDRPRTDAAPLRAGAPIDWQALLASADAACAQNPAATAYSAGPRTGFDEACQRLFHDKQHPEQTPDEIFTRRCNASREWTDLDLLLRTARETKIQLLLICQPLNANFNGLQGLTERARTLFYERLQRAAAPYPVRLRTFPEAETDPHFYRDCAHPSAKGWLVYDRVLDEFFHEPGSPGSL